jgi:hypothetical protein
MGEAKVANAIDIRAGTREWETFNETPLEIGSMDPECTTY